MAYIDAKNDYANLRLNQFLFFIILPFKDCKRVLSTMFVEMLPQFCLK